MRTNRIMLQGISSGCGKSTLVALLCRHFRSLGLKVAPFKAQNLSLNSFVTSEGKEIGISQAFQAWAAGIEPEGAMNPILLKPGGEQGIQVVLEGRPVSNLRSGEELDREMLLEVVSRSFDALATRFDLIVIEGAGSPAELNLRGRDIANMRTAEMLDSPVVLVGDIDRGGVFAGIYGTHQLLAEKERARIKGYIINRFRGDGSILGPGISRLSELTGVPCLGVMPMVDLHLPSEDALTLDLPRIASADGDAREVWKRDLDALLAAGQEHLDLDMLRSIAFS